LHRFVLTVFAPTQPIIGLIFLCTLLPRDACRRWQLGGQHIADASRRWAITLDDGTLVFVDSF
jgi:hypothetical protein